jgi:hypothetical protein
MRVFTPLLCVFALSCVSVAQTSQSQWENLRRLKVDQKIQITETNGSKHTVYFLSASDSAIRFRESFGERSIEKSAIRSVKLTDPRRFRNALIGLGVGGAGGAILGAATASPTEIFGGKAFDATAVGILGAVIGAGAGALLPTHKTVYIAEPH